MTTEEFNKVIEDQIGMCKDILVNKAAGYATEDRLHNFACAAGMMRCDRKEALAGMMEKHTVSIYDMCRDGKQHPIEMWNEKITDHINYLLLLKAIVTDSTRSSQKFQGKEISDEEGNGSASLRLSENDIDDAKRISKALKMCGSHMGCPKECPYAMDGHIVSEDDSCWKILMKDAGNTIDYLLKCINPADHKNEEVQAWA